MMKQKSYWLSESFSCGHKFNCNFFEFQVTKDQSSVTEVMQIYSVTTCKLLGIPRHIGQAFKAALLCKEEVATKVLSTVAETKYPASNFYWYFSNNLIVPVVSTSAKAL